MTVTVDVYGSGSRSAHGDAPGLMSRYQDYVERKVASSLETREIYDRLLRRVASGELDPKTLDRGLNSFLQINGPEYAKGVADLSMRFLAGIVQAASRDSYELFDEVASGTLEPPPEPLELDPTDWADWIPRLIEAAEQAREAPTNALRVVLDRVASGELDPEAVERMMLERSRQQIPASVTRLAGLYIEMLTGLEEANTAFGMDYLRSVARRDAASRLDRARWWAWRLRPGPVRRRERRTGRRSNAVRDRRRAAGGRNRPGLRTGGHDHAGPLRAGAGHGRAGGLLAPPDGQLRTGSDLRRRAPRPHRHRDGAGDPPAHPSLGTVGRVMTEPNDPIAIIGMRGRFPGADDLDDFWRNLAEGVESITPLSREDMRSAGIPDQITSLPGYVHAAPLLGDVDMFDASFFGFSARDAALTDPQHRLFLETAWEALEDAGYDPAEHDGPIGVFGGCELSTYLYQLGQNPEALGYIDGMQLMVTNDKDHLCTQVSYRLDLRGPSVVVQTTCSTSLVAVAMACESLQVGRCDMALAGGVTVRVPQRGGYFYVAGSILSPDGHCRPFDANAQGTIVGSGVGLVVLKRLEDALADGDGMRAVILGVGINNDGSDKVGYTAPGIRGQTAAVAAAYESAGITPDTVGYIEAHGTGTILGDPIELSALTEVFRDHTDRRGFCGIGSVKSNFGHLVLRIWCCRADQDRAHP